MSMVDANCEWKKTRWMRAALVVLVGGAPVMAQSDWKEWANNRIEQIRKGEMLLEVKRNGQIVAGASVTIEMKSHDFEWGLATNNAPDANFNFIGSKFNTSVANNHLKWAMTEKQRGNPDYSSGDAIVSKTRSRNLSFRGHTLLWGRKNSEMDPSWVYDLPKGQLLTAMRNRVRNVVNRYKGKIHEWDFNNEMITNRNPPNPNAEYVPEDFYTKTFGPQIIDSIFKWVHDIDPEIRLTFNEFGIAGEKKKAPLYADMVRYYLARGLPKDKIGINLQAHMADDPRWGETVNFGQLWQNLEILAATGLPIKLSEFDYATANDSKRAEGVELVLRTAFSHPSVEGIIHWRAINAKSDNGVDVSLWNSSFKPNAAGRVWEDMVLREWWTRASGKAGSDGRYRQRIFYGTYQVSIEHGGGEATFTLHFPRKGVPQVVGADANGFSVKVLAQPTTGVKHSLPAPSGGAALRVLDRSGIDALGRRAGPSESMGTIRKSESGLRFSFPVEWAP